MQLLPNSPQRYALPSIQNPRGSENGEWDKVSRLQFCNELLDLVKNNSDKANTLLQSDEINFHVTGYMNEQSCRYWVPKNPHELHQRRLHSAKVTVCCAVYSHGITDPIFLSEG
jgi:hypothetical protein